MATTGVCDSWKAEVMQAAHCFNTTVAISGTTASTTALTALASTAGISVGMKVTGTNIAASTFVSAIVSATAVTLSVAATGSATNTMTFTADVFQMILIKTAPTRTFDHTQTNAGTPNVGTPGVANVGTDETTGTGYTSGGTALTNVGPSLPGNPVTTATISFSNPSWTTASFSATAAVIQNTTTRLGGAAAPLNGRTTSVHDFGGTQTVSSGTFTVIMPTNDGSNALLRIA